jgi:uncharacterized damage-inducible protein DinB
VVSLETLNELYDYNYWARDRQLEACGALTEEQFLRPMGNSFSSLRDTLAHLLVVEWAWHERFRGRSPRSLPSWLEELRNLPALRERWAPVEQDLRNYVAGLDTQALACPLTYINLKGETWTYPLWQALFHLINHQTYHRGQVTTLLRQLGARPAQIDFLVYFDARG